MGKIIHILLALLDDILNGLTGMDLKEINTLSFISMAIFILLIYYVFSKDRVLDKKFLALEKRLQVALELKVQDFIGQNKQQKEETEGWRQELEEMLEQKFLKFTDESEQQREKLKTWQHSLEDNLLKLANQNKADAAILELQHKEKQGLEQKTQELQNSMNNRKRTLRLGNMAQRKQQN